MCSRNKFSKNCPGELSLQFGSFLGVQRKISLEGNEIRICDGLLPILKPMALASVRPTDAEWLAFREALNDLGVWKWKSNYKNPGVMDGAGWHFVVAYCNGRVESGGDNNYPESNGLPNNSPVPSAAFEALCRAASELTNGFNVME